MLGESPNDKEAARDQAGADVRAAVAPVMPDAFPTPTGARIAVPEPRILRMSEGQYGSLRNDVDALKGDMHELKGSLDRRFEALATQITGMVVSFENKIERAKPDISRYGTVAAIVVSISIASIGGFLAYVKGNIEGSISELKTNARDDRAAMLQAVKDIGATANANHKESLALIGEQSKNFGEAIAHFVPRDEVMLRTQNNKDAIETKLAKDVFDKSQEFRNDQVAALRTDVERIKGDIVTRRENETTWSEVRQRIDLLSNRLTEMQRTNSGLPVGDQIRDLSLQLQALQTKAK